MGERRMTADEGRRDRPSETIEGAGRGEDHAGFGEESASEGEERTGYRSGDPEYQADTLGGIEAPRREVRRRTRSGSGTAGRARGSGNAVDSGPRCDLCGGPMLDRHCKLVCLTCGFQRDCSDP